jgi:hypothetical protein
MYGYNLLSSCMSIPKINYSNGRAASCRSSVTMSIVRRRNLRREQVYLGGW